MIELRQSTAVDVLIGPFVDSTDGDSEESALTISQGDVLLSKNGQSLAQKNDATACVHDDHGCYNCELDATDTGTLGSLVLVVRESGALAVRHEFQVVSQEFWDAKYSTGQLGVDVESISGDSAAADNLEAAYDGTGYDLGGIDVSELNSIVDDLLEAGRLDALIDAIKAKTDNLPADPADDSDIDSQLSALQSDVTAILADTNELQTDDVPGLISALNDPTAAAIADAVWDEAKAGHVGAGSFGEEVQAHALSSEIAALNDLSSAEVNAEVDTALADYDGPTKAEMDAGFAGLNDPTAAAIADAVLDEALSGHTGAGSLGKAIADIETDATAILADTNELQTDDVPGLIAALNDLSEAEVNAQVDAAIETYHLDHLFAATYDPASKPGAADALLNELVEDDGGVSRFTANALEEAPTGGSAPTAEEIADAVLDEALSGHTGAGSLGKAVADIETDVTAILADTDELQTDDIPSRLDGIEGATFNTSTDSLEAIRDRGDAAWITGGGGSISDILNVQALIPTSIDLADTATVRLALGLTNMVDDLPSTAEIDPGTITIDRKAIGGTSWSNVVNAAACSEAAGIVYFDEVFDDGSGYAEGDSIRITFKSQKITVAANDYEITGTDGWIFQTSVRETMRGTDAAALASVATEARLAELDAANLPADLDAVLADTDELQSDDIPGTLAALNDLSSADVETAVGAALATYDPPTKAELDSGLAGLNDPSAADIADAVLDEALAGHVSAGTLGKALADIETDVTAVLEDTGTTIPALIAALNDLSSGDVETAVGTALGTYDPPTKAEMDAAHALLSTQASVDVIDGIVDSILVDTDTTIPALIAALENLSAAEVNAEVVDALTVDTIAELSQGIPAKNPTVVTALMLLYMKLRNQVTVEEDEVAVYNDAGTKIAKKAVSDDGSTYTEGKMASGA